MTTSYPGSLDAFTNPVGTDTLSSPSHAGQHANANDAIEAIEALLGTNPFSAIRLYLVANKSIADDTNTTLAFDTTDREDDDAADYTVSSGEITINRAGWYAITANVSWESNATGYRQLFIVVGGNTVGASRQDAASVSHYQSASAIIYIAADTVVKVDVRQNSGSAKNILLGTFSNLSVLRMRG